MLLIWSGSGAMVAIASAGAGVGAIFLCTFLGLGTGKAIGVGGMAAGVVAWLLGKHDAKLHPCSIFFIPLRAFAVVTAAAGALFFVTPEKPKTEADTKVETKLKQVTQRLSEAVATGSDGKAQEVAARYAALKEPEFGSAGRRCHVILDAAKVELYIKEPDLKKFGEAGKKALCAAYLKRLRTDFPQASAHCAIRGLLLWGVTGSQTADAPVIKVDSDEPRF
ncbi:MAG TPA: hypothetical protein VF950_30690 [Planctomycetota bacterium]